MLIEGKRSGASKTSQAKHCTWPAEARVTPMWPSNAEYFRLMMSKPFLAISDQMDWTCAPKLERLCFKPPPIIMERFSLTELIAAGAIIIALVGFLLDLQNREEDRVNRAWSLVAAAKEV